MSAAGPSHKVAPPNLAAPAGATMGTTWSARLVLHDGITKAAARSAIQQALDQVVAQMSTWDSASDISRFNRAPPGWHMLPPALMHVLDYALHLAEDSGGAYDPSIGPLVDAWGFGPRGGNREPPSAARLAELLARAGWDRIKCDRAGHRAWQAGGIELDLSSIAKGHGVDAAAQALDALDLRDYLVEVGGELRTRGRRPDGLPWRAGIASPQGGEPALAITLRDQAMATSGDYQRYFHGNGKRYAHTIDPRTGMSVDNGLASVTVVHKSCMQADAIATALIVLGLDAGLTWAADRHLAALFIERGQTTFGLHATPAFEALMPAD